MEEIISIGWDVGGWLKKNAFAALALSNDRLTWRKVSVALEVPETKKIFSLDFLKNKLDIELDCEVIIAIDAPLGFPKNLKKFITNRNFQLIKPVTDIDNCLAYRLTDMHIFEECEKKPLSPVFEKMGRNTTLAIGQKRIWENEEGFITITPSNIDSKSKRKIIEVYPAVIKNYLGRENKKKFEKLINSIPQDFKDSTQIKHAFDYYNSRGLNTRSKNKFPKIDELDACLCAIMGMAFIKDNHPDLPKMNQQKPKTYSAQDADEGWIYYPEKV